MRHCRCRKYVGSMTSNKWSTGSNTKTTNSPRPSKAVRGRVPFHRRSPVPAESDRLVTRFMGDGLTLPVSFYLIIFIYFSYITQLPTVTIYTSIETLTDSINS
jgi:hypothetical protein